MSSKSYQNHKLLFLFSVVLWMHTIFAASASAQGNGTPNPATPVSKSNKVVIFPFDGINVSEDIGAAVSEVFSSALVAASFVVIDWEPYRDTLEAAESVPSLAQSLQPPQDSSVKKTPSISDKTTDEVNSEVAVTEQNETESPPMEPSQAVSANVPPLTATAPGSRNLTETQKKRIASAVGATGYIDGKVVRLGTKYTVRVNLKDLSANVLAQKEMKAADDNDLYLALTRIAVALKENVSTEQTQNLNNATLAETNTLPNRARVQNYNGFMLGGGAVFGSDKDYGLMTGGYQGVWEVRRMRLGLNLALNFGSDSHRFALSGGLLVSVYLSDESVSPYLGGAMGVYIGDLIKRSDNGDDVYEEDSGIGFVVNPVFGVEFLRETRIRLFLELKYGFLVSAMGDLGHGPMLAFGLAFN
ncbi:MAG: hypothetical protein JXX14_25700 [Deltaproteobacteria bacterium]|nr:hypothetical protein [Deltaproteobacteria bacterium]